MNPGNGIETLQLPRGKLLHGSFLLMNPGNGIETCMALIIVAGLPGFPINESWQRD